VPFWPAADELDGAGLGGASPDGPSPDADNLDGASPDADNLDSSALACQGGPARRDG
jgi:hypothetical protein